jgi:hypothetical protein
MSRGPLPMARVGLRLLWGCALFGSLGWLDARHGGLLAQWLLPWWRAELLALDDTFRIDTLEVVPLNGEHVVRVVVGLAHCVVVEGLARCSDPRGLANASTLAANVSLGTALLLSAAWAWPAARAAEYAWRALGLLPALVLMWSLDVPMVLWGSLWSLVLDIMAPGTSPPLLQWRDFVQSGGRQALALSLGALVVLASQRLASRRGSPVNAQTASPPA